MLRKPYQLMCLGVLLALGIGCASVPKANVQNVSQVVPSRTEVVTLDQITILADASGSEGISKIFALEKELVQAFVKAMPAGEYESGINSFAGVPSATWVRVPVAPMNSSAVTAGAAELRMLGGLTPLARAIRGLKKDLAGKAGRGALVVYSDGEAHPKKDVLAACQELADAHAGALCIYTVQVGTSKRGARLLNEMTSLTGCGQAWNAQDLLSADAVEDMARQIFFGQSLDSDGDGVLDEDDECPGTPKGVAVDSVGCPLDSDGDGVYDYEDECPGTPEGVEVDSVGCPLDSDGDGVYDYEDECPGTPKGATVDARGCWVLMNLNFDTAKFDIKAEHAPIINEVVEVLKNNPEVRIRVDGHTDSRGTEASNQALSENRAKAVREALVQKGIAASRLEAQGFGEAQPIAPNDTPANLAKNRRVELTVL